MGNFPGTETGEICLGTDGNTITLLKKFVFEWTANLPITCTTLNGTSAGNTTLSGCTGGATGGSSLSFPGTNLVGGGTIPWTSGTNTTVSAPTLTATSAKDCPGYVAPVHGVAPTEPSALKISATVTADTGDGIKVATTSATVKGAICVGTDLAGTLTDLQPFVIK